MRWYCHLPLGAAALLSLTACTPGLDRARREFSDQTAEAVLAQALIDARAQVPAVAAAAPATVAVPLPSMPADPALAWWDERLDGSLLAERTPVPLALADTVAQALAHSTQIKVFSDIPLIRETAVNEVEGQYAPRAYAEAKHDNVNDPVGSTLTTGGPPRFQQDDTQIEGGLRKRVETGGEMRVFQRFGNTENNSVFFVPDEQATSRVGVALIQPLLRGAGLEYNTSVYRIALADTEVAKQEFLRQAESHLLEVARAYWNAYLTRALLVQKRALAADTEALVARVEGRAEVDTDKLQLSRARAASTERAADLARAEVAIDNAGSRLRALVNSPSLTQSAAIEVVASDRPYAASVNLDQQAVIEAALRQRPELKQAYLQYKAALLREGIAANEVLPKLDFIVEGTLRGLERGDDIGGAWDDGTDHGASWLVGLRFEYPLGASDDDARLTRRRLETRQQLNQLHTTINTIVLEAEISANEVRTALRDVAGRRDALAAARTDLDVLQTRWSQALSTAGARGAELLEFLLDAQDRKASAEERYAASVVTYNVALLNLERAKGNLLQFVDLAPVRDRPEFEPVDRDEALPRLDLGAVPAQ